MSFKINIIAKKMKLVTHLPLVVSTNKGDFGVVVNSRVVPHAVDVCTTTAKTIQ